jgi:hypothetical protein
VNSIAVNPEDLIAPDQCAGGSFTVVLSYVDLCESANDICSSSFTVVQAPAVVVTCPENIVLGSCATQQFVDDTFNLWKDAIQAGITAGCTPAIVYTINGDPVNLSEVVAPDHCTGGLVSLIMSYTDLCESGACTTSFSVLAAPAVLVTCPTDVQIASCTSQQEIDSTFAVWISALQSSISGGCMLQTEFSINGDTMPDLISAIPPDACAGGVIVIESIYYDLCESGSCTSTFVVPADMAPVMTNLPGNNTYNTTASGCQRTIPITIPDINDDCDANPTIDITSDDPSIDFFDIGSSWLADFPLGVTTITITGTDQCGNITDHVFTVTIIDNIEPTINGCPANITVSHDAGTCGSDVYWLPPTASDNCPGVSFTGTHTPGDFFPIGTTNVEYVATDASGLMQTCQFTITVNDTLAPPFNCGSLPTINLTPNVPPDCTNDTNVPVPVSMDNCGVIMAVGVRSDARQLNDSWFDGTTTTITWTFTDPSGNETICTQDVVVAACTWPTPYIYVDSSKTSGGQSGADWANALMRIEEAMVLAEQYTVIQEIWVAKGTYRPTTGSNRNGTYSLLSNVKIIGGFEGLIEDMSDRDVQLYPTILSGDIGVFNNETDNSYHIVTVNSGIQNAILDGLTIQGGYADGPSGARKRGAGIDCSGDLQLVSCTLASNYAENTGAAIYMAGSAATVRVSNCLINNNTSGDNSQINAAGTSAITWQGTNQVQNE